MLQESQEASSIVLISNSSSIITFSDEIFQGVKGYLITHVINIYLELSAADSEVAFSELIGYVPS